MFVLEPAAEFIQNTSAGGGEGRTMWNDATLRRTLVRPLKGRVCGQLL